MKMIGKFWGALCTALNKLATILSVFSRYVWLVYKVVTLITVTLTLIIIGGYVSYDAVTKEAPKGSYSIPVEQAPDNYRQVYRNLVRASGEANKAPPLHKLKEGRGYAFSTTGGVFVGKDLIRDLQGDDDLIAFVLAHELAHVLLGHHHLDTDSKTLEHQADMYAIALMRKAGYNVCKAMIVPSIWLQREGNSIDSTHPSHIYRAWELTLPNCGG